MTSVEQRRESIEKVLACASELGLAVHGLAWSPMVGSHGNHEYLVWLRRAAVGGALDDASANQRIRDLTRRSE